MFTGLSAFPLTPMNESSIDDRAFAALINNLVQSKVDAIGVLGSTGSYAYLTLAERAHVTRLAVEHAQGTPVMVGIGALRTRDVLALADDAQQAGASAVLLAPMSYQKLTSDDVFTLYETVTRNLSIPLCVYDNPGTTHFTFDRELHVRIAQLPQVQSIKLPPLPADPATASEHVAYLRQHIPATVSIGISGDATAIAGIQAGCTVWYSVIAGLFPNTARQMLAANGTDTAVSLAPLWAMFRDYGSLRVIATAAELLGLVNAPCLPQPLYTLQGDARSNVQRLLNTLDLS